MPTAYDFALPGFINPLQRFAYKTLCLVDRALLVKACNPVAHLMNPSK